MAIGNMFTDLKNSAIGNVEKAKLYIYNTDSAEDVNSQSVVQSTAQALASSAGAAAGAAGALAGGIGGGGLGSSVRTHVMTVQYNPSTLSIQANAESIPFTYLQQNIDNGIPNQNLRPPMVVLSVQLVFDAVNTQDAFMLDKLRLGLSYPMYQLALRQPRREATQSRLRPTVCWLPSCGPTPRWPPLPGRIWPLPGRSPRLRRSIPCFLPQVSRYAAW